MSLDGDPARAAPRPTHVTDLAEALSGESGLVLGGVMAVAPLGHAARPRRSPGSRSARGSARARGPAPTAISAGMSGDLEQAVAGGATHLRIGTALLGARRPYVR